MVPSVRDCPSGSGMAEYGPEAIVGRARAPRRWFAHLVARRRDRLSRGLGARRVARRVLYRTSPRRFEYGLIACGSLSSGFEVQHPRRVRSSFVTEATRRAWRLPTTEKRRHFSSTRVRGYAERVR